MKITVVPLSGKPDYATELDPDPDATINDLKTLVLEKYGIPMYQQLLLFPSPSPPSLSSPRHFTSPYGPLEPLDTVSLSVSSTVYLTLRLRVLLVEAETETERELFVDLNWGCTIGNLRDQVKCLTKIPTNKMSVSWGTLKFGPYNECTLESVCHGLWDNPTQPFIVRVVSTTSIITPHKNKGKAPLLSDDLEDGQLDMDSEDERAHETGYVTPGAVFTSEHRRKYNDVGPLRAKRGGGTFFGVRYKKTGSKSRGGSTM